MKKDKIINILMVIVFFAFITITLWLCGDKTQTETNDEHEVEFVMPNSSNKEMMELLKDRNGKLVIEICEGKVLDDEGNGESYYSDGKYYIKYDSNEYKKGDEVLSIFMYNPNSNAEDDITHRLDIKK